MTLILTRADRDYVLQVTDRLVTQAAREPFDSMSNKNVLLCSRNGVLALAYTGLAYIGGVPTDQWIVETLTGFTFDRDRKPPAFSTVPTRSQDIGQALMLLRDGLEHAPIESRWLPQWKASSFDLSISGWQWSKRYYRPILAWLSKREGTLSIQSGHMPRYWHWDRVRSETGFKVKVGVAPSSNLPRAQFESLTERLADCDPDQAERTMVEMIRDVSRSLPLVGPHCMSILLKPPSHFGARVRYIPAGGDSGLARLSTSRGATFTLPVAFTPWLVGPGVIFGPSIISGTFQANIGTYTVTLEAPDSPGPIGALLAGQQRPRLP